MPSLARSRLSLARRMKRRADCPTCHEAVRMPGGGSTDYERGILPNPQLEQQVDHYSRCREPLRSSLVRLDVLDGGGGDDGNVLPPSSKGRDASGAVDDSAEPAPGGSAGDPPPRPRPKRRPTHRYHGLSRKKLAALCRADGLDAKGDEATLRRRHADFVTRYNAECDATRPRSAAAVARDVQGRERAIQVRGWDAKRWRRRRRRRRRGRGDSGHRWGCRRL